MVNIKDIICKTEGCDKIAAFGVDGTKTAEYCRQHALGGLVNVKNIICSTKGCGKRALFGVTGTKTAEYCRQHALDGMMINVHRKVGIEDSGMISTFRVADMKSDKHCAQHNRLRCGIKACRRRWIDPNLSGKEINGAACPSGSKYETVHPPPAQASPFSSSNRGSS